MSQIANLNIKDHVRTIKERTQLIITEAYWYHIGGGVLKTYLRLKLVITYLELRVITTLNRNYMFRTTRNYDFKS